jgi:hypothetical protein
MSLNEQFKNLALQISDFIFVIDNLQPDKFIQYAKKIFILALN